MTFPRFAFVYGWIGAVSIASLTACENPAPPHAMVAMAGRAAIPTAGATAGRSGSSAAGSGGAGTGGAGTPAVAGAGVAGSTTGSGSAGTSAAGASAAGASAAGANAAGANAAAGAGGLAGQVGAAAGGGGTIGGASGESAGGAGGQNGAAGTPATEEDPLNDPFGQSPASCDGLLCLEDADCTSLYPDQIATCKLTKCVDFTCE